MPVGFQKYIWLYCGLNQVLAWEVWQTQKGRSVKILAREDLADVSGDDYLLNVERAVGAIGQQLKDKHVMRVLSDCWPVGVRPVDANELLPPVALQPGWESWHWEPDSGQRYELRCQAEPWQGLYQVIEASGRRIGEMHSPVTQIIRQLIQSKRQPAGTFVVGGFKHSYRVWGHGGCWRVRALGEDMQTNGDWKEFLRKLKHEQTRWRVIGQSSGALNAADGEIIVILPVESVEGLSTEIADCRIETLMEWTGKTQFPACHTKPLLLGGVQHRRHFLEELRHQQKMRCCGYVTLGLLVLLPILQIWQWRESQRTVDLGHALRELKQRTDTHSELVTQMQRVQDETEKVLTLSALEQSFLDVLAGFPVFAETWPELKLQRWRVLKLENSSEPWIHRLDWIDRDGTGRVEWEILTPPESGSPANRRRRILRLAERICEYLKQDQRVRDPSLQEVRPLPDGRVILIIHCYWQTCAEGSVL